MNTNRLEITFNGRRVGANIQPNVSLEEALAELAKTLKQIEDGDYDVIDDIDGDIEKVNINDFVESVQHD